MEIRFTVLLAFVVLASGCSQGSLPDDASEGFKQLKDNSDGENFHVEYEISTSFEESVDEGFSFNVDFYSFDGVQKAVGTSPNSLVSTTTALYNLDNNSVTCRESGGEVSCMQGEDAGLFQLVTNPRFDSFNYSGSGTYAGRDCKMFEASPDMPLLEPPEGSSMDTRVCLDRGMGYPGFIEFNISDEEESASITLEALSFDRDVKASDVELPKALSVSSTCYSDPSVSVTALKDIDSAELSVNGGESRSVELGNRFESKSFDISDDVVEGSNEIVVETGEQSVTETCYFTNYSFNDPSYDFSDSYGVEESSFDLSQYSVIGDRIDNGGFSDAEMVGDNEVEIGSWNHTDGTTGHIRTRSDAIDGKSIGIGWKKNGFDDQASISQNIDLTGVEAIGLDVQGTSGNPQRSKIILEVNGEEQGYFIKRPQREETYRDLGVELSESYSGVHTVRIKWVQVQGDNLGNSIIDNVRAYR